MLRSLQQAVYSPENVGHFGLAYESYTHFTSPIRRYPDLLVHRAIKAVLQKRRYESGNWAEMGLHCSMTERRADDATRDVEASAGSLHLVLLLRSTKFMSRGSCMFRSWGPIIFTSMRASIS